MPKNSTRRTQKQLIAEIADLRARLDNSEEILRAIRSGEVDALIVSGEGGEHVYTFKQVEEALRLSEEEYRTLVNEVNDGFYVVDQAGVFTFANPALARMYGVENPQALVGRKFMDFIAPEMFAGLSAAQQSSMHKGLAPEVINGQIVRPDGTRAFFEIKPVSILKGDQVVGSRGVVRDISERKRAEEDLKKSEIKFRTIFDNATDGMFIIDPEARKFFLCNTACARMLGYSQDEFLNLEIAAIHPVEDLAFIFEQIGKFGRGEEGVRSDLHFKRKDGSVFAADVSPALLTISGRKYLLINFIDITEHKRAEEALRASEAEYRDLFENSVMGISQALPNGRLLRTNIAYAQMYGYANPDEMMAEVADIAQLYANPEDRNEVLRILNERGVMEPREITVIRRDGTRIVVLVSARAIRDSAGNLRCYQAEHIDITKRKQAEVELIESKAIVDAVVENIPLMLFLKESTDLRFVLFNRAGEELLGYDRRMLLGKNNLDLFPPEQAANFMTKDREVLDGEAGMLDIPEEPILTAKKGQRLLHTRKVIIRGADGATKYLLGISEDITERKQAEESLARSEKEFRTLAENALVGIFRTTVNGDLLFANDSLAQILGFGSKAELMQAKVIMHYKNPADRALVLQILLKEGKINNREIALLTKTGETRNILLSATLEGDQLTGMIIDISVRKEGEKRIQRQLEHLTAMSSIDRVIAANFDLKLSLFEILTHVTAELGIDAADILILNPSLQMLEFGAERGFRIKNIHRDQIRLGVSFAGRVALERQPVYIPNLNDDPVDQLMTTRMKGEDFVCYYGVPLIAKGQIVGVLEIFHRSPLEADPEWVDFLNALAGEAAIAIENATLFESLQRSNLDLGLAYDATIEGWSRALDLRDKETEGHTQRVTEMAMELARAFGVNEADLMQVRWGALLHDIGKMGIPDGILLKPGPLTDEEWVTMKKHPTVAYEMLSPIRYLRLALDIPYCHHEKWDGTGYPQGLKGNQIPLVARIFAIVDVWDALRSDRPYRAAWNEERVREHIRKLSGTHFDPQVVDVFMQNRGIFEPSPPTKV